VWSVVPGPAACTAADALHRPESRALVACTARAWAAAPRCLHRAADALHRALVPLRRPGGFYCARVSAAAPWWPPPRPGASIVPEARLPLVASTAPLMLSTGPRLGCRALVPPPRPRFGCRPGGTLHRPRVASTGPRFAPRPVRRFRASAAGALAPSTGRRFAPRPGGQHRARGSRRGYRSTGPAVAPRPDAAPEVWPAYLAPSTRARASRRGCRCARGVRRVMVPALHLSWNQTGALSTSPKNRPRCPLAPSTAPEVRAVPWCPCRAPGALYRARGSAAASLVEPPRPGGQHRARGSRRVLVRSTGPSAAPWLPLRRDARRCALVPLLRPSFAPCLGALHCARGSAAAPLMRSTGPRFGCRRCGWLYRALASAAGALVASTGPRFAPWRSPLARGSRRVCCRAAGALHRAPRPNFGCRALVPLPPLLVSQSPPKVRAASWRHPPRPSFAPWRAALARGSAAAPWWRPPRPTFAPEVRALSAIRRAADALHGPELRLLVRSTGPRLGCCSGGRPPRPVPLPRPGVLHRPEHRRPPGGQHRARGSRRWCLPPCPRFAPRPGGQHCARASAAAPWCRCRALVGSTAPEVCAVSAAAP
jgi:hypothetical protein